MVRRIQLGPSLEKPRESVHFLLSRPYSVGRRVLLTVVILILIILYTSTQSGISAIIPFDVQHVLPSPSRTSHSPNSTSEAAPPVETANLHLLLPATSSNPKLCKTVLSAALLNYPLPILVNWGLQGGEYELHLAKIDGVLEYLRGLPPRNDKDLVLIADGHDVWFQLRPDVLIGRYYEINRKLTAAAQAGFKAGVAESHNISQTVIFGADKKCWPQTPDQPACYSVPKSSLPEQVYGWFTDQDPEHKLTRPRWLNSGTVIGPVSDVRAIFEAAAYKVEHQFHGSRDQWYFAEIYGEQEWSRHQLRNGDNMQSPETSVSLKRRDSDSDEEETKIIPVFYDGQQTEFHMGLDYESQLGQTMTFSAQDVAFLTFNSSSSTFKDILKDRDIQVDASYTVKAHLPEDVLKSPPPLYEKYLTEVVQESSMKSYDDMAEQLPMNTTWGDIPLLTNIRASTVPVMIHINGNKTLLETFWPETWWMKKGWGRHLLRAGARAPRGPIAVTNASDGTVTEWYKGEYNSMRRENGGIWTDKGQWLMWHQVCGEFEDAVFQENGQT